MWRDIVRALVESILVVLVGYVIVQVWSDIVLGVNGQCEQQVFLHC